MNRGIQIMLLLLIAFKLNSQTWELYGKDTINKIDANGKKQDRWVLMGKHKPGACYQLEQKVEEGKYVDNRKTGVWVEYYCNSNLKSKLTFINGRPDGYAQMYHENGKISEEGIWKNNRWVGKYKLYYENGQVQHEFVFNNSGKRDGPQKYFYENGQVAIEGAFANGKESGLIKEYYETGDTKAQKTYNDGEVDLASVKEFEPKKPIKPKSLVPADNAPIIKVRDDERPNEAIAKKFSNGKGPMILNGQHTLYNKNKQITKDGFFIENRFIDGKVYFYDENGLLQRIAVYKNGIYVGDTQGEN
ncbi:MAG: hypothetical protein WCR21_03405 [Bacteroidota bacterium]